MGKSIGKRASNKGRSYRFVNDIDDAITQSLVTEFEITEQQAIDLYFQSKTYGKLIDEHTALYQKTWQDIYELLKIEMKDVERSAQSARSRDITR